MNVSFEDVTRTVVNSLREGGDDSISDDEVRRTIADRLRRYADLSKIDGVPDVNAPKKRKSKDDGEPVAQRPSELRVPEAPNETYWYEPEAQARMFDHYVLSRRALGRRVTGGLLITGPAGSGKTRGVVHAVERINREHGLSIPLLLMHCPTITDPQKWFGRREIDGKGSRYETSDFVKAVESGAVIVLDEFMRLHPTIHNSVMGLLDGSESVLLSDLNLTIERHPETVFIGTTNQGSQFGGTHRMDWAMRERWSFTIERDFPPPDEEARILVSHNPGCDRDAAAILVDIAVQSRTMYATGDLRTPISTRTLDNAAFLVASGMTEKEALSFTALPEYDSNADGGAGAESDREKISRVVEGRLGR